MLYPLKLRPELHSRVWGGRQLATHFGKSLPTTEPYGESWEVHDSNVVENGAHAGQRLGDLVRQYGAELIGADYNPAQGFPLLVKLLDAQDWLSIQVHPNDEQAQALEGDPRGKTEAWIVLAAQAGAKLVTGVQSGTNRQQMAQAIQEQRLETLLVYSEVQAGSVLYMPAGTIHAIGAGIVIYEIQQSSDVTYRLYDWGRVGLDGKPRPLHIEKGVQVSNVESVPPISYHPPRADGVRLVAGPYFQTLQYVMQANDERHFQTHGRFHALTCIEGSVTLIQAEHELNLALGESALVPACLAEYRLRGAGRVLCSSPA